MITQCTVRRWKIFGKFNAEYSTTFRTLWMKWILFTIHKTHKQVTEGEVLTKSPGTPCCAFWNSVQPSYTVLFSFQYYALPTVVRTVTLNEKIMEQKTLHNRPSWKKQVLNKTSKACISDFCFGTRNPRGSVRVERDFTDQFLCWWIFYFYSERTRTELRRWDQPVLTVSCHAFP